MTKGNALQIGADQPIEEVVPLAATSDNPVAVVDEDERLIGEVPRTELLLGMAGEGNNNDTKQQASKRVRPKA